MSKSTVMCLKLKKELPALDAAPYPGAMGQAILEQISAEAWQMWLGHQTMLINEYRLSLIDPKAREFLQTEMQRYLFKGEETTPPGYQAESNDQ